MKILPAIPTRSTIAHRSRGLRTESGMSLVEVLIATLVLSVGLLGTIGGFDSARKLDLLTERRTSMAHRAQLEVERLQAQPYGELAMSSTPTHSTVTTNPDYYVKEGSPATYQYGTSESEAETLVESKESKGAISASPAGKTCSATVFGACGWKDGNVSGSIYDFITWYAEHSNKCAEERCLKRITVVVTANALSGKPPSTLRVSTVIASPPS